MVRSEPISGICTVEIVPFIRGDADGNGIFAGLVDALTILEFGFLNGPEPPCLEATDADGDGIFNALSDATHILEHNFLFLAPPPAPYPACGFDPDPAGSLGCNAHSGCQ